MKKLLLTVLAAVLAVGAGFAVANHYKNYQNKKARPQPTISLSQANRQLIAARTEAAIDRQALVTKYNAQVAECQKGKTAYDKLTPFIKNQTAAPACGAPL